MDSLIRAIPERLLSLAKGALAQANTHAVFSDPGNEHWDFISVLNTAHAGELFLKAIIAKQNPLLIFKDIFSLDDKQSAMLDLATLIKRGKTHDFEKLPQVLWVTTGIRIPDMECFERLRAIRNAVQHFCAPETEDFRRVSLEFIYTIIDPLICRNFGLYAIEYHEDYNVGYDYLVGALLGSQLKFSVPDDFSVSEIDLREELEGASEGYLAWFTDELSRIGRRDLLGAKRQGTIQ